MNDALETPCDTLAPVAPRKAGLEGLQVAEHRPEQFFREVGISFLIGVGEIIAAGRRGPAQRHQRPAVQAQPVADVVEADGVRELGVDQAHQMAPWAERAGFLVHTGFPRQFWNQIPWDEMADLPQYGKRTASR